MANAGRRGLVSSSEFVLLVRVRVARTITLFSRCIAHSLISHTTVKSHELTDRKPLKGIGSRQLPRDNDDLAATCCPINLF